LFFPRRHTLLPRPDHKVTTRLAVGAVVLLVLFSLAGCTRLGEPGMRIYLDRHSEELDRAASNYSRPVRFTIEPGMAARTIAKELQRFGLIRDPELFEAYVRVNSLDDRIQAGVYVLDPSMSLREVVEAIQHANSESVSITILEGWRFEQTADYLTKANVLSDPARGEAYRSLAASAAAIDPDRYPFLRERPQRATLEGYLFPDTYEIPATNATAVDVLTRQLETFAARVLPLYAEARANGTTDLSLHEVLTLASIVEREAVVREERPTIAGVYLNRLANGIKLDADPTVQYAMGYQPAAGQWWKTPVMLEEYSAVDSPYNTYLNAGLPPGPIAAPGLSSIEAVLDPEEHNYLYFVALPDGTGRHVFAVTYDEHVRNVAQYMGQ
jgi:UPF0755 protein